MANINGLIGYNSSGGTNILLAAYGNDIINVATGLGYPLNLTSTADVEFVRFLDRIFFQNYSETPKTFNGTTWSFAGVRKVPLSKYIHSFKNRVYLGFCKFHGPNAPTSSGIPQITFPSRVFHSDIASTIDMTWGIEWHSYLQTNGGSPYIQATQPQPLGDGKNPPPEFKSNNIKVGDPLFITNAGGAQVAEKQYTVQSVESEYRLRLTENIYDPGGYNFNSGWVGGNWFDVAPDDGDVITGFGENNDRLLIFKLLSLWYYTGSQLKQVPGAPGTSYQRSVINDRYGNTYYFHGSNPKISGIYKYNGVDSKRISKPIDPFIAGVAAANYDNVVAWGEGPHLRFYLGNLTATNLIDAMTNAVATYNTETGAWSIDPIADAITASTVWRTGNQEDTYLGTSADQVLKADSGNAFKTTAISSTVETKVYYPAGSEIICNLPYIQVIGRNLKGILLKFKLWDDPVYVDQEWISLGECTADKTEFTLPPGHFQASGIQFKVDELGTAENDWYIEKISIFYKPDRSRLL